MGYEIDRQKKTLTVNWLIDFNGMSTCLELFHA